MSGNTRRYSLNEICESELNDEIIPRRRAAGLFSNSDDGASLKNVRQSLTGMAFSGGGFRSAAFCLGVWQAFHRKRLTRYIDYLSTVSGGGYLGTLISSLVNHPTGKLVWRKEIGMSDSEPNTQSSTNDRAGDYSLQSGDNGKQSSLVRRLITSGPVMRRPVSFLSAYFFGLFLTNLVALPGLIAMAALAAIFFRSLDHPVVSSYIGALGFEGDISRALFPAFVLMLAWTGCMILGNSVQSLSFLIRISRVIFILLVTSLAMGVVALIVTGDIDVTSFTSYLGLDPQRGISIPLPGRLASIVILLVALIPYLHVRELIRSGVRPRSFRDRWIFSIASNAMLYGVPLFLFGVLASENISYFNPNRPLKVDSLSFSRSSMLYPSYFKDWSSFWLTAEASAKGSKPELNNETESEIEWLRLATNSLLWDVANGIPNPESAIESLPAARFQLLNFDSKKNNMDAWMPTDGKDVEDAREELADAGPADATVIDLQQDQQASGEDYRSQSFLNKWWLLTGSYWTNDDGISFYVDQELDSSARDRRICDRLNYQIISNPFLAAAYIHYFNERRQSSSSFSATDMEKFNQLKEALNHSAAAATVSLLLTDSGRFSGNPIEGSTYQKLNAAQNGGEYVYLKRFFIWQALKHQLLYLQETDDPENIRRRNEILVKIREVLKHDKTIEHRQRDYEALESGIRAFNLGMLSNVLYPDSFMPQSTVFAAVVLDSDQTTRWKIFYFAAAIFLFAALLVNLNFSSIHSYYQQNLSHVWIVDVPGFGKNIPLVRMENTAVGAPYQLLNGTQSLQSPGTYRPSFPRGGFLFSKMFCGGIDKGFLRTSEFHRVDLPTAMSISGAAITPSAVSNQLVWTIMFVCNMRTGQWLAWPAEQLNLVGGWLCQFAKWMPGMAWHVIANTVLPRSYRSMEFIYDGGLYENLGVEALLLRRCRLIVAVDASEDGECRFTDFQQLIHRSRSKYDIKIDAIGEGEGWMDPMTAGKFSLANDSRAHERPLVDRFAAKGYMWFSVKYPAEDVAEGCDGYLCDGWLIYVKPSLLRTLHYRDVLGYARNESEFPQDSTINQFYTPAQFDSYRSLGESIGQEVVEDLLKTIAENDELRTFREWCLCPSQDSTKPGKEEKLTERRTSASATSDEMKLASMERASKEDVEGLVQLLRSSDIFKSKVALTRLIDADNAPAVQRQIYTRCANEILCKDLPGGQVIDLLEVLIATWSHRESEVTSSMRRIANDSKKGATVRQMARFMTAAHKSRKVLEDRLETLQSQSAMENGIFV